MALKLPICTFDAKTGILCAKCESKLKAGQISQADVEASKALVRLAEKNGELNKISLLRAVEVGGDYVMEFEQADLPAVRSNPATVAKLEQALKGRVWVVGSPSSDRRFLEDLFYPTRILTVNTVWMADGSKLTKAIVAHSREDGHKPDSEKLKAVVGQIRGIHLAVETESDPMLRN